MSVRQMNSFMTLVAVWMPSGMGMFGYSNVTSDMRMIKCYSSHSHSLSLPSSLLPSLLFPRTELWDVLQYLLSDWIIIQTANLLLNKGIIILLLHVVKHVIVAFTSKLVPDLFIFLKHFLFDGSWLIYCMLFWQLVSNQKRKHSYALMFDCDLHNTNGRLYDRQRKILPVSSVLNDIFIRFN